MKRKVLESKSDIHNAVYWRSVDRALGTGEVLVAQLVTLNLACPISGGRSSLIAMVFPKRMLLSGRCSTIRFRSTQELYLFQYTFSVFTA